MQNFKFSGHESFVCKQLWPKKAFDFLNQGHSFNNPDAVVELGVGKNMVLSIRFWLKSIGLTDENEELTTLAKKILSNNGYDPYLEDIGTIWLFHYMLVSNEYASIYNLIFNDFLKINNEFSRLTLHNYLKRISTSGDGNSYNEKTVTTDINVFFRNYLLPGSESKISSFEDEYSSLFLDLDLIRSFKREGIEEKTKEYFIIERKERKSLPKEIFLYVVLQSLKSGKSISFNELLSGYNSVGNIFQLNREGIYQKIEELQSSFDYIKFTQTAGVPVLTFTELPNPLDILSSYYENVHVYTIH
ncbi:MAG: DUF4007 family protein [Ignavibacteriae bacterium]|nr:DUF4007 family protein [Ignavibacteriota bacterium]